MARSMCGSLVQLNLFPARIGNTGDSWGSYLALIVNFGRGGTS